MIEVSVPRAGEAWSEDYENVAHDYMSLGELLEYEPRLGGNFRIGRARNINNAFAAIYKGERLLVYDPELVQTWAGPRWLAIMGHELGHHVCGHQGPGMLVNPREKELEADQFSGFVLRLARDRKPGVYEHVLESALKVVTEIHPVEGSPTHPPRDLRLAKIVEGFNKGTTCIKGSLNAMGVEFTDLGREEQQRYNIRHHWAGIVVTAIQPSQITGKGRLNVGDVIVEIEGVSVSEHNGYARDLLWVIAIAKRGGVRSLHMLIANPDGITHNFELELD